MTPLRGLGCIHIDCFYNNDTPTGFGCFHIDCFYNNDTLRGLDVFMLRRFDSLSVFLFYCLYIFFELLLG